MRLASILTTTRLVAHGDLELRSSLRRRCRSATDASEIRRSLRPGSFPLTASTGILRSVSSPLNTPSPLIPRTISVRAAAGGGAGSGGGRKGKRRPGKKGRQQQEPVSTENVSVTAFEPPTEHASEGANDSSNRSEDSSSGGSGSDSSAANAARRRKPKGAPKGPAARRWSFEQLMAVWDSQFQRVSACDGGGGAPTALDIARVAAAGQQRFGRGCVLVQVHVRAKLRGSAAGFGAGPGAAGMGKRGAGKGKGGAKGKGNAGRKGEGEWEEPTTEVLETSVEYVPRGMLLLEDDDRWGIMEESEETRDAAGDSETTDAPTVGESRAAGAGGATGAGGDTGRAGLAGEVGEVGVEVPAVSQGDLTGLVRCAGDSSRLLQLTAPTNHGSNSSSSSGGGGGVGGTDAGSAREENVVDAELVEGGRKAEEIGGNNTGRNAFQVEDTSAGGMPEWGAEAPYDEHQGEFVLVLWLHMDGQAVAGADVVRACSVGNPEGLCSLVEFAGVRWEGDAVKLVVRDMEGVEEEEAELEIV